MTTLKNLTKFAIISALAGSLYGCDMANIKTKSKEKIKKYKFQKLAEKIKITEKALGKKYLTYRN